MSRRFAVPVLFLSVLAGGCGATPAPPVADKADNQQQQQQQIEAIRADCMKQKGFKYVAYVYPPFERSKEERAQSTGDHAVMKSYREKNGFGVFAAFVFPEKFMTKARSMNDDGPVDPNFKLQQSLPEAQRKVYGDASETCYAQGVKKVHGKDVKGMGDHYTKAREAVEQIKKRELNGDPQLVELAAPMADCLKAGGYKVGAVQPTALAERGQEEFRAKLDKYMKSEPGGEGLASVVSTDLNADTARPHLAEEVKAALADLACGKDFYPLYQPKEQEISQRVYREFGLGSLA